MEAKIHAKLIKSQQGDPNKTKGLENKEHIPKSEAKNKEKWRPARATGCFQIKG